MNTSRLNFTRLNTSVLNSSVLNSSLMGGRGKGSSSRPSGLIAQYKPYLNSNDSPTRDVLKDYSGHGNDVTLHNFAFAWMSGYDAIPSYCDFNGFNGVPPDSEIIDRFKVVIHSYSGNAGMYYRYKDFSVGDLVDLRFQVKGLSGDASVKIEGLSDNWNVSINERDICSCSCIVEREGPFVFRIKGTFQNTVIEFLPPFPGALVSDGVDDYGICETFPILTKEKGYTVCALRKWLNKEKDQVFLCKTNNPNHGAFMFECYERNEYKIYSYGQLTRVNEFPDLFSHQKTNQYNTTSISVGNYTDGSTLFLFRGIRDFPYYCEIALYALEIYDRDLSEEEIEQVKQRMIADYEKATGNILEPEENVWLWGDGDTVLWGDGTNVLTE